MASGGLQSSQSGITDRIIEHVADDEGVDVTDLDPLYEVIDPEALELLFAHTSSTDRMTGRVIFRYHGYDVTVFADGHIEIDP